MGASVANLLHTGQAELNWARAFLHFVHARSQACICFVVVPLFHICLLEPRAHVGCRGKGSLLETPAAFLLICWLYIHCTCLAVEPASALFTEKSQLGNSFNQI